MDKNYRSGDEGDGTNFLNEVQQTSPNLDGPAVLTPAFKTAQIPFTSLAVQPLSRASRRMSRLNVARRRLADKHDMRRSEGGKLVKYEKLTPISEQRGIFS